MSLDFVYETGGLVGKEGELPQSCTASYKEEGAAFSNSVGGGWWPFLGEPTGEMC